MSTVVQLELWQLIVLLLSFFTFVAGFGKVLLSQFEQRLTERFKAQDQAREAAAKHWDFKFEQLNTDARSFQSDLQRFKVKVAEEYWRREDAIRQEVTLHAKIDALALKIDNWALRQKVKSNDN